MVFNPDPSKQAEEIIFSSKIINTQTPLLTFNNGIVSTKESHKHLGMILDRKLSFKANKGIGLIKRLYNFLPRQTLINIYKSFLRPHLDYVIIYKPSNPPDFDLYLPSSRYGYKSPDFKKNPLQIYFFVYISYATKYKLKDCVERMIVQVCHDF